MSNWTVSALIRDERTRRGHSLAALARVVGVGRAATARWERGDVLPSIEHWPALAQYLGLDPLALRDMIEEEERERHSATAGGAE